MERMTVLVAKYQEKIKDLPNYSGYFLLPGIINHRFLISLTTDIELFLNFLLESRLIKNKASCTKCGNDMTLLKNKEIEKMRWVCNKKINGVRCTHRKGIRHESWFTNSKMSFEKIMLVTFDIINHVGATALYKEHGINSNTAADWTQYIRETLVKYIENQEEKIGGPGSIVEIDESQFGTRKYHRGHPVNGQWVFGGVERVTGRCFFEKVDTRDQNTLTSILKKYVMPGTTIYSDCWKAYNNLNSEGYIHLTVNHSQNFVDPETGVHTNTIESTWRHIKALLPEYNRQTDYANFLAEFMFRRLVTSKNEDIFNVFLEIVRETIY